MMKGKVAVITGATNGIGEVTAHALAEQGATIVIISRSAARLQNTVNNIIAATGNSDVYSIQADLSDMSQVHQVADGFLKQYSRLDILVNNAGAIFDTRQESVDGYEKTLALNHLSYFCLTNRLLPILTQTSELAGEARIVNVSSDAHYRGDVDLDDIHLTRNYNSFTAYSTSKLMNIFFTYALARRLSDTTVTANALHPGFVHTGFGDNMGLFWRNIIKVVKVFGANSPQDGAQTQIYLASSPAVKGITGKYWVNKQQKRSSNISYDENLQEQLWQVSEQLVSIHQAEKM